MAYETDIGLLRTWLKMARGTLDEFDILLATLRQAGGAPVVADGPPLTQYDQIPHA